jgi:hypothetical protein
LYSLALIIFVVSEKKAFEHFHIGSKVSLCITYINIGPYVKMFKCLLLRNYKYD